MIDGGDRLRHRALSIGAIGRGSGKREYELQACIAKGGMGEVFIAKLTEPNRVPRLVVVKRLLRELREDFDHRAMFQSEGEVLAHLDHPNIVAIFDAPTIDGTPCLAIEYVNGRSVSQILERCDIRGETMPVQAILYIMVRVLRGLAHAHHATQDDGTPLNLVHRDITPGNLMVSFEGDVKITDFGISKSQISVVSTTVGIVKGKARYLAPEQILGEPASPRSDLFSTACVLLEMLTGRPLFERPTVPKTLYAIVHGQRQDVVDMVPVREPLLIDALETALSTDPKKRQVSASELADALEVASQAISVPMDGRDVSDYMRSLFEGLEEHWEEAGFDALDVDTASGEGSPEGLTAARAAAMSSDRRGSREDESGIVEVLEVNDSEIPLDGLIQTPLERQMTVRVGSEPAAPIPTPSLLDGHEDETLALSRSENATRGPQRSGGALVAVAVSETAAIASREETVADDRELRPRASAVALRLSHEPETQVGHEVDTEPPRPRVLPPRADIERPAPRPNRKARARPKTPRPASEPRAVIPRRLPWVSSGPALFVAFAFGTLTGVVATLVLQRPSPPAAQTTPAIAAVPPEPPAPAPPAKTRQLDEAAVEAELFSDDEPMPELPSLALKPLQPGTIDIDGPKGARVRINGKPLSARVPVVGMQLAPGLYKIEVRRGRRWIKHNVEIVGGARTEIAAKKPRRRRRRPK